MTRPGRGANGRFVSSKPPQPLSKDPMKDFISMIKANPAQIEKAVKKLFSLAAGGSLKALEICLKYGLEEKEDLTAEQIHEMSDAQLEAIVKGEDWRKF